MAGYLSVQGCHGPLERATSIPLRQSAIVSTPAVAEFGSLVASRFVAKQFTTKGNMAFFQIPILWSGEDIQRATMQPTRQLVGAVDPSAHISRQVMRQSVVSSSQKSPEYKIFGLIQLATGEHPTDKKFLKNLKEEELMIEEQTTHQPTTIGWKITRVQAKRLEGSSLERQKISQPTTVSQNLTRTFIKGGEEPRLLGYQARRQPRLSAEALDKVVSTEDKIEEPRIPTRSDKEAIYVLQEQRRIWRPASLIFESEEIPEQLLIFSSLASIVDAPLVPSG